MRRVAVADRWVGEEQPILFVVEEGQANQGNYGLALEMIDLAAACGADAIEFQFAEADEFYVSSHPNHAVYRQRELSDEQLRGLRQRAAEKRLLIVAAALGERMVERVVTAGYPLLDVNSSDLVNPRMLDAAAASGLPFFMGTAMATIDEIDWAVARVVGRGARCALLHGQHVMAAEAERGVPSDRVHLLSIQALVERYDLPVGFIDHTSTVLMPALAVAAGASIVTKHLAPRAGWAGPDSQICLAPDRMKECVEYARLADQARGASDKCLIHGERDDRVLMRRSIVAAGDLPAGTVLRDEHLRFKRPGSGLPPRDVDTVLGRRLTTAVRRDDPIRPDLLAE